MALDKIHLTVHVTWTSFSPSNDIAKRNWAPSFIAAGVAYAPKGKFVKKKKKIKKTKTFLISKI